MPLSRGTDPELPPETPDSVLGPVFGRSFTPGVRILELSYLGRLLDFLEPSSGTRSLFWKQERL